MVHEVNMREKVCSIKSSTRKHTLPLDVNKGWGEFAVIKRRPNMRTATKDRTLPLDVNKVCGKNVIWVGTKIDFY